MKTLRLLLSLVALLAGMPVLQAQVVSTQPVFFQDTTPITLTFDASQGNAALAGFTGPVYIWTGVITNNSTNNSDWKYVKSPSFNTADPAAQMTRSSSNPNLYTISFTPRSFYGVPAGEQILKLAMIFKNANGSVVGRGNGGSDIFVDVQQSSALTVRITNPVVPGGGNPLFLNLNDQLSVTGTASASTALALYLNNTLVTQQANATTLTGTVTAAQTGRNVVRLVAGSGAQQVSDSLLFVVRPAVNVAALPAGAKDGVTYLNGGTSVILNLTAPNKQFVYALGEWNNWQVENAAYMNKTPDGTRWWIQVNGLTPGVEYAYQYLVDGTLRIADPYTEKVLDPNNDSFIPAVTYPNLKPYPTGRTTGIVSVLQTAQTAYQWQVNNFQKPKKTDLVIYELLVRDFIARHDYQTLRDTLNYLQRLGVNAIGLMPFNEFEGNESWGYNPSFYFAPDKYYGTKNELKQFIDECHRRGIAVIMDMVLNHSCGQSPMVQMYFDGTTGKPAANSPWFNQDATHPFNVCYDFNHESPFTQYFVEKVNAHWLQEYKIDGYRFDLSKGFTQVNSGSNVGQWGQYDQSRVNIWNRIYGQLTAIDPTVYCILEHFADNTEEKVLADAGMMLWGNMNFNYSEATMGFVGSSDLSGGYYGARTWNNPHLVTYMESHDEERQMYKNLTFGNQLNPAYNPRDLNTALARSEAAAAFFFTVPGPKMVWQFGEVGYDVNIDFNGRTGNKPIRWNYYQDPARRKLYDTYRYLIALKKADPVFETGTFTQSVGGATKTIHLSSAAQNITVIGNFDVTTQSVNPAFQSVGKWYNYLTGDSITVTNTTAPVALQPGQYAVYTSRLVKKASVLSTKPRATEALRLTASPNPTSTAATLRYELATAAPVTVAVVNMLGSTVRTITVSAKQAAGAHQLQLPVQDLANGIYIVRVSTGQLMQTTRLVVQH
ncbi:T9SS type A sorting domain-containing protein [Microvirga sp. STR05]|uniref:T9SS type A sorting domain-containing protein n=1 Tax=Hymenobacter duratus TaxID=2771356 RepID=A0ABR8JE23_9BACT|nr:alpha-amylase family glycosyl hydrolase [Hymenobacter duratus]MBD2715099.1 T9SS type A sorting domain-containing protein [Hymenobacter duratus]MBR7950005.1 T9SS type A sorting domain-containing protein [Microvirga sp. STR05]